MSMKKAFTTWIFGFFYHQWLVCIEVCHKSGIRHSMAAAELLKSSFPTSLFYTDFLVQCFHGSLVMEISHSASFCDSFYLRFTESISIYPLYPNPSP